MPPTPIWQAPVSAPITDGIPGPQAPGIAQERSHSDMIVHDEDIQSEIIGGVPHSYRAILYFRVHDVEKFKPWLKRQSSFVATNSNAGDRHNFRRNTDRQPASESSADARFNIAFTYSGLKMLSKDARRLPDEAFKAGLAAHAHRLGVLGDNRGAGHPSHWVIGGFENGIDGVMIVSASRFDDLQEEVERLETTLLLFPDDYGVPSGAGASIVFRDGGAILPAPGTGDEQARATAISLPSISARGEETDAPEWSHGGAYLVIRRLSSGAATSVQILASHASVVEQYEQGARRDSGSRDAQMRPSSSSSRQDEPIPTGGGYFFVPSIDALKNHLS